jgi:hypothetical protein
MAAAKCDVSFKIGYESSLPLTEATVSYLNPPGPTHDIKQLVTTGNAIKLNDIQNDIQTPGTYELEVKLAVGGIVTKREFFLNVGRCNPSSTCYVPKIYDIKVLDDGQIVMNYWVDDISNLATLEYQIARDPGFTDIIYSKVGFSDTSYTQFENIDMKNGKIPDNTKLYIRIRKYCKPDGISDWSDVVQFDSKEWSGAVDAYCLSGVDDLNPDPLCNGTDPAWKVKVILKPSSADIGTLIYLTNGMLATPTNIKEFEPNAPESFKRSGIRWIRFLSSDLNPSVIYRVDPENAKIISIEDKVSC